MGAIPDTEYNNVLIGHCLGNYGDISYTIVVKLDSRDEGEMLANKIDSLIEELDCDSTGVLDRKMKNILNDYTAYILSCELDGLVEISTLDEEDLFSYTDRWIYDII